MLTDQALVSVLGLLEGLDIGRALLVCRGWSKLLQGDAGFMATAQQLAEAEAKRRRDRQAELERCYAYDDDGYRYGWRAHDYDLNSDGDSYGSY
jgi:hypothetical protein